MEIMETPPDTGTILFVGNSLTYRGGGIDRHFAGICDRYTTERVVKGGASLTDLRSAAFGRLERGDIDIAILQEDIPETTVDAFSSSVRDYSGFCRSCGVVPILLMTWSYPRLDWIDITGIADAHRRVSEEAGVQVIPAGIAWELFRDRNIDLYTADREHPSVAGSYLSALCIEEILPPDTDADGRAEGAVYRPDELSVEDAGYLKAAARAAVAEFKVR